MADDKKNKVLALYKYLRRYTDEKHPVTMKEICTHMEENGYSYSQDTALRNMKQLREELDVDIISNRGRYAKYFMGARLLEKQELKLIIDAVNASNFISRGIEKKMLEKLKSIVSIYEAKELERNVLGINIAKTENDKILYNVDSIQQALNENCQISCDYMKWSTKKELVPKYKEKIVINPWALIWANDRYYLYGYIMKDELEERCYRVDKLANIEVLDSQRKGEKEFKSFDANTYVSRRIGLFSGPEAHIRVKASPELVGAFIDQFGKEETLVKQLDDENNIIISFTAAASNNLYGWLLGLGKVEILSPKWVRAEMMNLIEQNRRYY